jgi:hypothetical protein
VGGANPEPTSPLSLVNGTTPGPTHLLQQKIVLETDEPFKQALFLHQVVQQRGGCKAVAAQNDGRVVPLVHSEGHWGGARVHDLFPALANGVQVLPWGQRS